MRIVLSILVALNLVGDLSAAEFAGVQFDDTLRLDDEQSLVLNGVGVRKKYFVSIYVAALHLTKRSSDAYDVINMQGPKRVTMHILYSEINQEKFASGWNDGFRENHTENEMQALRSRLDSFNSLFETLHKGDRVILDYLPELGTRVTIQNKVKGTIQGEDFFQGLLKVWLGDRPVTKSLKNDFLGQ
ncbi:MAG: chalcone isomerase family protein [Pseudomonadota bacterium]